MLVLLLVCIVLPGIAVYGNPATDNAPYFSSGPIQALTVCKNSAPVTINSELAIVDSDAGQTETWTINTGPAHGSLTGFPVSATSSGGAVTPSWLEYTPATGFTGSDTFSIQVTDGMATALTAIVVTVNALPALSSTLTPPAICDGSVFNYTPTGSIPGASFAWHRVFAPGISNPTASGTGNPAETLGNITNDDVTATYSFTISANGCSSQSNVIVTIHPTPRLNGAMTDTLCSGNAFYFVPTSPTSGISYSWVRHVVAGISPATADSGNGIINEVLTNITSGSLNVTYTWVLTANGCTASRNQLVTIYPMAPATSITTAGPATVCTGAQYLNFGAGSAPATGASYTWSAINATILATGINGQYCLVSFPNAGNATITLTSGSGAPCASGSNYQVMVGNDLSPTISVIYYNYYFVCQDNTQDSYQWGYDDVATLDSSLISGATFQSYQNTNPDFGGKYYWVITTKGGCMQKTYFNGPLSTTNLASKHPPVLISIAPNPAHKLLNVSVGVQQNTGNQKLVITDLSGHVMKERNMSSNSMQIDINELPAGCYLLSYFENSLKLATSRFIKDQE